MHLSNVTKGKIKKPYLICLYGIGGVGKSTFASQAPDTVFLGPESGTNELDVNRLPEVSTWKEIIEQVTELIDKPHDYKTLAIDSLDWCEPLLWDVICKRYGTKSIDQGALNFGKGRIEAKVEWLHLKDLLNKLRDKRQMNIILLGHPRVVECNDPAVQGSYSRYELKLDRHASAIWSEYVDAVLFGCFETFHTEADGKAKAYSDGVRVLYTERRAGWDAKNRYGLPLKIDLNWNAFHQAVQKGNPDGPKAIRARIEGLLSVINSIETKDKARVYLDKYSDDAPKLVEIEKGLAAHLIKQEEKEKL